MKIVFLKFAGHELDDAARYYELEYGGPGRRFRERDLEGGNQNFLVFDGMAG